MIYGRIKSINKKCNMVILLLHGTNITILFQTHYRHIKKKKNQMQINQMTHPIRTVRGRCLRWLTGIMSWRRSFRRCRKELTLWKRKTRHWQTKWSVPRLIIESDERLPSFPSFYQTVCPFSKLDWSHDLKHGKDKSLDLSSSPTKN